MLKTRILLIPAALIAAGIIAGCGSNNDQAAAPATTAAAGSGYGAPAASTSTAGLATVSTASGDLGDHIIGTNQHTLYLFEKDTGSMSTCTGACASDWPPLLTTGAPMADGGAKAGLLSTTKRADGTVQVTYGGHPVYYFAGDTAPGDTAGQGVDAYGAEWYAVAPTGKAVEGSES